MLLHSEPFQKKIDKIEVPKKIEEAPKTPEWKNVVLEEMNALKKNGTWEVVDLLFGKHPVGCKWVFIIKYKLDDSTERYKARLVAKDFTQTFGVDYTETFASIAKLNVILVLDNYTKNSNL